MSTKEQRLHPHLSLAMRSDSCVGKAFPSPLCAGSALDHHKVTNAHAALALPIPEALDHHNY